MDGGGDIRLFQVGFDDGCLNGVKGEKRISLSIVIFPTFP